MTRIALCFLLLASMVSSSFGAVLVKGDIVKLDRAGTFGGANGGGEFALWKLTSPSNAPQVWTQIGKTFCLEFNEFFSLSEPLIVGGISDRSVWGGIGGQVSGGGDPMDDKTKFLYKSYVDGTLRTQFSSSVANNDQYANALQKAIWKLEDEISSGSMNTLANNMIAYATANQVTKSLSGVVALNLFAANAPANLINAFDPYNSSTWAPLQNYRRQDQIFYIAPTLSGPTPTVPEPASIAIFAVGSALAGLARWRAKRSKANVV